ncbi:hypothetical protein chiPu_0013900 [Chiloscyllium punctatum]|uniref:Uncharacterized protein n=1 Tax=Chiloscyllium punctatum TaxID=137246 RepID=A0A401SYM3_CHIPU|nr:hypothetical protein [Chiloscyllium punctatum]
MLLCGGGGGRWRSVEFDSARERERARARGSGGIKSGQTVTTPSAQRTPDRPIGRLAAPEFEELIVPEVGRDASLM